MLLPQFNYHEPATLAEACEIKGRYREDARLLAGGTDLLVHLKKGLASPEHIISLGRIKALAAIDQKDGAVSIGAGVTVTNLIASTVIARTFGALKAGGIALGSPSVRNRATIGGNINSARPAGDLIPSLMVYGATLVFESVSGTREMSIEEFITGPGKTLIRPDEIMTRIVVPVPLSNSGAAYLQLGKRKTLEINIVNVASFLSLDSNGAISMSRITLGSVGPTPLRATAAEAILTGKIPDEALFFEAAEAARQKDCRPIDDFRGSAGYRRAMVGVLTKRTLAEAYKAASA